MKLSDLTSTHPPISERIKILRGMMLGHGANYNDYQKAFSSVKKSSLPAGRQVQLIIPASGLSDGNAIPLRESSEKPAEQLSSVNEKRKMGNIMMAVNNYSFLTCKCGLKIKIPPGFGTNKSEIVCPRCGTVNKVESAREVKN